MGIITSIFRRDGPRASEPLDNPRFTLNDAMAMEVLGGRPASSGVSVNSESALTYSPWWRGVNLIANGVGKPPCIIYRRDRLGLEPDPKHPGYSLALYKPNPYQTANEFRIQLTGHALSAGNGYAYIYRDGAARPLELWPLDPHSTSPVRETVNGRTKVWYVVDVNGEKRKLAYEDVIHIKGLSYDGLIGYSVVNKAREPLGLGLAGVKYQAVFFRNGGRPGVVLEAPMRLLKPAKDELRESWERMHAGLDNSHRTAILDAGMKAHALSFSAEDSQLLETRAFGIIDTANFIGLHPYYLGHQGPTGYGSLEQMSQALLSDTFDPWLIKWEMEQRDKLLTEEEKDDDTHLVKMDREALVLSSMNDRGAYWQKATGRPWATTNQARAAFGMNADTDPKSDTILDPLNMGSAGGGDNTPKPPGKPGVQPPPKPPALPPKKPAAVRRIEYRVKPNPALEAALCANLRDAALRVTKRVTVHARRTAKEPAAYLAWLDSFRVEEAAVAASILEPACKAAYAFRGNEKSLATAIAAADLLAALHGPLSALADACPASSLAAEVDRLCGTLEATTPSVAACRIMACGGEGGKPGPCPEKEEDKPASDPKQAEREKEDADRQAARDEEDKATAKEREEEDAKLKEERDAEDKAEAPDEDKQAERAEEDADRQEQRDAEDKERADERAEEDKDTAEARKDEDESAEDDARSESRDQEDSDLSDKRDAEDDARTEARDAEETATTEARDKADEERDAARQAADDEREQRHTDEHVALDEQHEKDNVPEGQRDKEKDSLDKKQEAESKAVEKERDKADAVEEKRRDKEDADREKRNEREDKEVEKAREKEDKEIERRREKEDRDLERTRKAA